MESHIVSEQEMTNYMNKMHYMVVFPEKIIELFESFREIQTAICIDYSTITKKIIKDEHTFNAKGTGYIFFIKKQN